MSTLRMQIAEVQITIRQIKADLTDAKQAAQGAAVTAAGGFKAIGANKEEREFALEQAVADSPAVKRYGRDLLIAESKLTRLDAELSEEQAAEQRDRWTIRARLVDALDRLHWPQPDSFFSAAEIDRVMDEVSGEVLIGGAAVRYTAQYAERLDPAVDYPGRRKLDIAVNNEVTPQARAAAEAHARRLPTPPQTSADRYRAENARRSTMAVDYPRGLSYDQIDQEADELFG